MTIWSGMLLIVLNLFSFSCIGNPIDTIISNERIQLTTTPLLLKCSTPLKRNRKSAAVHLTFPKKWMFIKGYIKFENGELAYINVVLIDSHGNRYETDSYGMAGDSFAASFSYISRNVEIVKIEITSSIAIYCDKIYWHCFDPI